jgi:hypothetical protein
MCKENEFDLADLDSVIDATVNNDSSYKENNLENNTLNSTNLDLNKSGNF